MLCLRVSYLFRFSFYNFSHGTVLTMYGGFNLDFCEKVSSVIKMKNGYGESELSVWELTIVIESISNGYFDAEDNFPFGKVYECDWKSYSVCSTRKKRQSLVGRIVMEIGQNFNQMQHQDSNCEWNKKNTLPRILLHSGQQNCIQLDLSLSFFGICLVNPTIITL